jgi:hypothetical protein
MPALRTKRVAATTSKNMGQPIGTSKGLNTMPSKKPASAAQSKLFESGALILLLLVILGNGRRWLSLSPKKWSVRTSLFLPL